MFLRARRWPIGACVFHIQPAKWTLRMSTFVLPVTEIVPPPPPPMCDKIVGLALFTERRVISAWTSPCMITSRGAISDAISDRVGKNRTKQEITSDCLTSACQLQQLFQQPTYSLTKGTSNWFSESHINSYEGVSPVQHPYVAILGAWE